MADAKQRAEMLKKDAASGGYKLNPDEAFVESLAEGLLANKERYGMETCPCRLYSGSHEENLDIVCPCVYRDDDLAEYGACYCALYIADGWNAEKQVPERRPPKSERAKKSSSGTAPSLSYPVYRCTVCGYLCANTNPPRVCPICKSGAERFERFM